MPEQQQPSQLKRLKSRYRFVIINDDTYEEVVTFKLTRVSVYVSFSMLFIILVGFTVALLVLTPLKYYIPGYGTKNSLRQLQVLKIKTDSLQQEIRYKDQYLQSIKSVLAGGEPIVQDTTAILIPDLEISTD